MTVLVFHTGSLGDTLITVPALRAVRAQWPQARVVMLHNAPARPDVPSPVTVLDGSGLVDTFMAYRRHGSGATLAGELVRTWWRLRHLGAEAAVFVGPSERGARALARDRRFLALAGVRRCVGFQPLVPRPGEHEAARKLRRLREDGVAAATTALLQPPLLAIDGDAVARMRAWVAARGADPARLVSLGIGSLMPSKAWPLDRFVELGRRLLHAGYVPMVVGGPAEQADGERLATVWQGGLTAAGVHSLLDSAALQSLCRAHVGLDSGATHLAAATGVRVVAVTSGFTVPGQWDPLGPGHRVLRHATPCEGCGLVRCGTPGHPCMDGLTTDAVWNALRAILEGTP